jgi:hypothetical protein
MTTAETSRARIIFPVSEEGPCSFYEYDPIIRSFGAVLVQVEDDDWSGDTRVLLRNGDRYGFLVIGWGSCSGCDALQGCSTFAEVDELINQIEGDIKWFNSLAEVKTYIANDKDRSQSFYAHCDGWREFQRKILTFVEAADH